MSEKHKQKKSKITSWKPNEDDILVTNDGKLFIIYFEKVIQPKEKVKIYDKFMIKKSSYEKQLGIICKYINFFLKFYDDDHEVILAYLKIKFALDKEKRFDESNSEQLIDLIYEVLFTDSVVEKICQMVEDNYLDDIESSQESKKYIGKDRKHLESLEFTNQHIKILLRISFGMKMIAPILSHYVSINVIKLDKDTDLIYNFYKRLFLIFSDNCNMYNKLFVYVKAKVLESKSHNSTMFEQRDILGIDEYLVIRNFLKKVLISENMIKYKFNEHWDPKKGKYNENIVGFNKTIIKFQLTYFLKEQYTKNLTEVTFAKNSDGLSGMDKMEMNLQKIDEGLCVLAEINIKIAIKKILQDNDFNNTEEEIQYYKEHHNPSLLQVQLVYSYWGKRFGAYRNSNFINRTEYIILMLTLKKKLLLEQGCCNEGEFSDSCKLPYILSGNVQDKVNTRMIRNNKFIVRVNNSYLYENIKNKKYKNLCVIKPDYIMSLLSEIINTNFTYVVYEKKELLGEVIEYDENKISDELLFFLNTI